MRRKSPELMSEIKKYIEDYYLQNRQSTSTTKIADAVCLLYASHNLLLHLLIQCDYACSLMGREILSRDG